MRKARVFDDRFDRVEAVKLHRKPAVFSKFDKNLVKAKLYSKNVNEMAKFHIRKKRNNSPAEGKKSKVTLSPIVPKQQLKNQSLQTVESVNMTNPKPRILSSLIPKPVEPPI